MKPYHIEWPERGQPERLYRTRLNHEDLLRYSYLQQSVSFQAFRPTGKNRDARLVVLLISASLPAILSVLRLERYEFVRITAPRGCASKLAHRDICLPRNKKTTISQEVGQFAADADLHVANYV